MDPGGRGVLAAGSGTERWLAAVTAVFVVACSARYIDRHGADAVLLGALALLLGHVVVARTAAHRSVVVATVLALTALWAVLTVIAPSFAWIGVPLSFTVLRVVAWPGSAAAVVAMAVVATAAWSRLVDRVDPALLVGPVGLAAVAMVTFRALEREAQHRQALVDELTAAQTRLAATERRAGALAERNRLSREIHDSVGQGLSSIILLLDAALRVAAGPGPRPRPRRHRGVERAA